MKLPRFKGDIVAPLFRVANEHFQVKRHNVALTKNKLGLHSTILNSRHAFINKLSDLRSPIPILKLISDGTYLLPPFQNVRSEVNSYILEWGD